MRARLLELLEDALELCWPFLLLAALLGCVRLLEWIAS